MNTLRNADAVIAESFLPNRAKLLEIAACLDRVDRFVAEGDDLSADSQYKQTLLREATEILLSDEGNRAAKLQHLFSREYEANWREQFGLSGS